MLLLLALGNFLWASQRGSDDITGQLLEACSCSVPCTCNFGRSPAPHDFCDSLAFFQVRRGLFLGVHLAGARFAIIDRGGERAMVYVDSSLKESQRRAIYAIAKWILSLEATPVAEVVSADVTMTTNGRQWNGAISGSDISFAAVPLIGNDGRSVITVSHPLIFGSFPVILSKKGIAKRLRVHSLGFSFEYQGTNVNNATFEFSAGEVMTRPAGGTFKP